MGKLLCKTALQKSYRGSLCLTTIDVTSKDTYKYDGGMTRCLPYVVSSHRALYITIRPMICNDDEIKSLISLQLSVVLQIQM
ncbi:hypothetical protein L1887_24089 [Cichorium endivia]|nr:hypothetical protein L1887_24089 [Cichorium endivia]